MTQHEALSILKTGANVFLTGEPGSGKTHTVNTYVAYLREHGIEPAITASTGIAATHLGGMTIHAWSGIGVRDHLSVYDVETIAMREYLAKRIRKATVLIIDEVSMLGPNVLSMVDAVCREVRGKPEAFGGLQVVLVGDFFQLPPIAKPRVQADAQLFQNEKPPRFAYDSPVWKEAGFLVCYLSEQYRQDDPRYLEVLSAIRCGTFDGSHKACLEERIVTVVEGDMPKLFSHNANVDKVNDAALAKIPGDVHTFHMTGTGKESLVAALKKGCLSPEELKLKTGAKVMFTKNDPKKEFVNGTLGEVVGFDDFSGNPKVKIGDGTTVDTEMMEWVVEEDGKVRARISQIPLRLAWAITVHKSQGMSMDMAAMDLSGVFEYGQGYVALSRVRRLEGVHLLGYNERAFAVDSDVRARDETFREASGKVRDMFAGKSAEEIKTMHENFIKSCGGTLEKQNKKQKNKKDKKESTEPSAWQKRIEKLRETYPNAYRPWKEEDDEKLIALFKEGKSLEELPPIFGRQPGSIRARLEGHRLIEPDPQYQKKEEK